MNTLCVAQGQNIFGGLGSLASPNSAMCLLPLTSVISGSIQYSTGNSIGPFQSGVSASLHCQNGAPSGPTTSTCINGAWQPQSLGICGRKLLRPFN